MDAIEVILRPEFLVSALVIVLGTAVAVYLANRAAPSAMRFRLGRAGNAEGKEGGRGRRTGPRRSPGPGGEPPPGPPLAVVEPPGNGAIGSDRPSVRFADVAGLDEAVAELREVKEYLVNADRFRALGADLPRGVLLYGPPGSGKTLLARALAGEAHAPFYYVSASSFVEQYVGLGAARIRQLFEEAKKHQPSIVFIDELDAIGRRRSGGPQGEREFDHTLNQLLVELDGFSGASGVLILAATNRPELLDAALVRPGRFDRRIQVDRPDLAGREAILGLYASKRPFASAVSWRDVASHTAGLAGAELAHIVNEAALLAARRGRSTIGPDEVEEAVARVLRGPRSSRVLGDREKRLIAYHEAGHALLSLLLIGVRPPPRISIVGRAGAMARSAWGLDEDREILGKKELIAQLIVLLGGRAAEVNVFGEPSTRAEDDLEEAVRLARRMVERWGMSGRFSLAARDEDIVSRAQVEFLSDTPVRRLLLRAEEMARTILQDNAERLHAISRILVRRETLTAAEVAGLAGLDDGLPAAAQAEAG